MLAHPIYRHTLHTSSSPKKHVYLWYLYPSVKCRNEFCTPTIKNGQKARAFFQVEVAGALMRLQMSSQISQATVLHLWDSREIVPICEYVCLGVYVCVNVLYAYMVCVSTVLWCKMLLSVWCIIGGILWAFGCLHPKTMQHFWQSFKMDIVWFDLFITVLWGSVPPQACL